MDEEEGEVEIEGEEEEEDKQKKEEKVEEKRKSSSDEKRKSLSANQQQLFLVEFLVDSVTIDSCAVDEEVLEGQTCISLSFLNFPPMDICEKDFDTNKESGSEKVTFNCGKSLMFAFSETQCERPPPLQLQITVFKKLSDEENSVKVEIGVIKICISELFRQIVDVAKYKPEKLPTSKSIKDCFMLIGPGKRTMGEVSVYIRLSCLGQNVVTEFQCGSDLRTSPVLFKSREGKKLYEFTNKDGSEDEEVWAPGGDKHAGRRGSKIGCGCIALPLQGPKGGQGDAGRGPPVNASYEKGNKVVLDVQGKAKEKNGDGKQKCGKKMPEDNAENQEPKEQNVFVLKVGDKGQVTDRGKMILEFRTPKQKILPKNLPPYHEEVAVQTDSGKKKGKGKDKKKRK